MYGKKKKTDLESEKFSAKYKTVCDALSSILKYECKKPAPNGNEVIDWEMTVRQIRLRARMALDFVQNIDGIKEKGEV